MFEVLLEGLELQEHWVDGLQLVEGHVKPLQVPQRVLKIKKAAWFQHLQLCDDMEKLDF